MDVIPSTFSHLPLRSDGETVASTAFFGRYLPAPGPNEKDSSSTDSSPLFLRSRTDRHEKQMEEGQRVARLEKSELGRLLHRTSKQLHQRLEAQRISLSLHVTSSPPSVLLLVFCCFFFFRGGCNGGGVHLHSSTASFFHFQTCHSSSSPSSSVSVQRSLVK